MSPDTPAATVVLVHGAWADGSSWSAVIADLHRAEIAVTAAPIPLTALDADQDALTRAIDRTDGPVVLAGHAYAGAVIAASDHAALLTHPGTVTDIICEPFATDIHNDRVRPNRSLPPATSTTRKF